MRETAGITVETGGSINANPSSGTMSLSTSGGGITEHGSGKITGNTLLSTTGVSGDVSLNGTGNAINRLGQFTTNGSLTLTNGSALQVNGPVTATNVEIVNSQPLTIGPAKINAAPGGRVSLVSDALSVDSGARINAPNGTVEISPVTDGALLSVGNPASQQPGPQLVLSTAALKTITTGTLRLGGYIDPNQQNQIPTSDVSVNAPLDLTGIAEELRPEATVHFAQNAPITVDQLSLPTYLGNPITLDNPANSIATLGDIFGSGVTIDLTDTRSLTVLGTVNLDGITLHIRNGDLTLGQAGGRAGNLNALTVNLDVTGAITEPNGSIIAQRLHGNAASASLTGNNQIFELSRITPAALPRAAISL